jgi:hypothetical protein
MNLSDFFSELKRRDVYKIAADGAQARSLNTQLRVTPYTLKAVQPQTAPIRR